MPTRVAILAGLRCPFSRASGPLSSIAADDLAALVARQLIDRASFDPARIDSVIFGNVAQPPDAANIARVIALKVGLPASVVAHTVHHNCASGMRSITDAALNIASGRSSVVLAGGTESMSRIPLLFNERMTKLFVRVMRARTMTARITALASIRPRHLQPVIALKLGLTDPLCGLNMGETAEVLAREFGVTRDEQDAFALESHRRAVAAQQAGRFSDEIVPIIVPPKYEHVQEHDDGPRPEQSMEALAKLKPYFDRQAGTVTVGNACPVTDGAVAVLMADEKTARSLNIEPIGFLSGWAYAGLDGRRMGLGPAYATARLVAEMGRELKDFDLVELNEAFAAQVLANCRAFESSRFARDQLARPKALGELDPDRLNVNGGAIAMGHPVGATGSRLVLTTLLELKRRGLRRGLATLCVGGGQGAALALEAA